MEQTFKKLNLNRDIYIQRIIDGLTGYNEQVMTKGNSVDLKWIETGYFLNNDIWNIDWFGKINDFKEEYNNYKSNSKNIYFKFGNKNINLEAKHMAYNKLFSTEWSLCNLITNIATCFNKLAEFINQNYPKLNSILDLNIEKAEFKWINWLENQGNKTTRLKYSGTYNKKYKSKTQIANFLSQIYNYLFELADNREEWQKDIWDVNNLDKFGIDYTKTGVHPYLDFTKITNVYFRKSAKKYFKTRLLSKNKFAWATALHYLRFLPLFLNYISQLEDKWNNLNKLSRKHIENYIEYLNQYTREKLTHKNSNPERYISENMTVVKKFLKDIKIYNYDIAPEKEIRNLIFVSDKPKQKKPAYDKINHIPNNVLDQVMEKLDDLHEEVQPIVLTMLYTGLRISDVLTLQHDCIIRLNNKYWIETDIEKTYVKGHRIPIKDDLADILAVLIQRSKKKSNKYNNPENYIFCRYTGSRKGKPFSKRWVRSKLNIFAREQDITNERGKLYHFKNHAFRHTYAVKMINSGVDILILQDLLAHVSPEMTMRYARLVDDTKRKQFEKAVENGVFSFTDNGDLTENKNPDISSEVIDMLWTNHKLSGIDTPYGVCLQRANGRCEFAKKPPCLTCRGGEPCKDLYITKEDIPKYELHIESVNRWIDMAKEHKREDWLEENQELLELYEKIKITIENNNIIYGRKKRLKGGKN